MRTSASRVIRPDVRALTLRVYEDGKRCYLVPGRQRIYPVFVVDETVHCTCTAASFGRECSHAFAVATYREKNHGSHPSPPR